MDETARPILEVGAVLLAAAAAGWLARRLTLPAVIGYLAVGLLVSPFTPGYVAEHDQLILFADVGVVFLLFEVGIEVDLGRLRRDQGPLLWAAPLQTVITMAIASLAFLAAGLGPPAAALLGLSIALSSSVVIVNITRSRRRTTDPHTERVLVGWGVLQDVTGVAIAIVLLALLGSGQPFAESLLGLAVFGALVVAVARAPPAGAPSAARRARPVPARVGVDRVWPSPAPVRSWPASRSPWPRSSPDWRSATATTRPRPAADSFRSATSSRCSSSSRSGRSSIRRRSRPGLPWFGLAVVLVVVAKSAVAWLLVRTTSLSESPVQVAVGLGQIGEFSFVLASVALARGAIGPDVFAAMLAAVAATIAGIDDPRPGRPPAASPEPRAGRRLTGPRACRQPRERRARSGVTGQ